MESEAKAIPDVSPAAAPPRRRAPWLVIGAGVLVLLVGGITAGIWSIAAEGNTPAAAEEPSPTSTATPLAGTPQAESRDEDLLSYAACMRAEGIDMPDPLSDRGEFMAAGADADSETYQAAQEKCIDELGGTIFQQADDMDRTEVRDAELAFAECMRDEGIEMDDPSQSTDTGPQAGQSNQKTRVGLFAGLDQDDPEVQAALEVCEPILRDVIPERDGQTRTR